MNSYRKSSITILFTVALLTELMSVAFKQSALAFSIDFSGLPGFGDNQGLNFFGIKGIKGDTGPQGERGEKCDKGDKGDTGAQGPQGEQGPAGEKSDKGDKGDKGDTGAQGIQGEKGETGEQGPPGEKGQGVEFGHLIVIVHMDDTFTHGQVQSSDFTVHLSGNQQSPDTFPVSEEGTDVNVGFGSYQVTEDAPNNPNLQGGHFVAHYSKDCSGVIHPNEEKTCTITNIIR